MNLVWREALLSFKRTRTLSFLSVTTIAFAVFSPQDHFKGWYANVAHPALLDATIDPPVLFWHDLYLDLVGLPDGSFTVRDDDELLASGLADANPEL